MKSNLMKLSAMLFAGLFLFAACSSEDDKTNKELLTAHSWKATAIFMGGADIFPTYDDCDKDDILTFNEDGTFQNDEGATKCDPDDPQIIEQGTYTLNADETVITTVSDMVSMDMNIVSISETKLEVTFTDPFFELEFRMVYAPE